ncbi:hypothetical protein C8J57DRAFT_1132770 [Mycena rebaudengoi]|nr:hypothetical protein C8J57DRAFT_1132770 [Mycena rebaudengoi]
MAANDDPKENDNASWTVEDVTAMLDFLVTCTTKATTGDGGNFKMAVFHAALPSINAAWTKGGKKTAKSAHGKYKALRKVFNVIRKIQGNSGWHWDNEKGADIKTGASASWDAFVEQNPATKPFWNKGWVHLENMEKLMSPVAKGHHVFRASQAVADTPVSDGGSDDGVDPPAQDDTAAAEHGSSSKRAESPMENEGYQPPDDNDGAISLAPNPLDTPVAGRKRAAASPPPASQRKKPRTSGGAGAQALTNLSEAAGEFNELFARFSDAVAGSMAPASAASPAQVGPSASPSLAFQPSPSRRHNAITRAEMLETQL